MERAVAFDVIGALFDVEPVRERFDPDAIPRVLHAAASTTLAGEFVPFPELVRALLGDEALPMFAALDAYPDAAEAFATPTEEAGAYKPHAAPYRPACERLDLPPGRVTLVAAHAWDVSGARRAGLPSVLVDRDGARWPFTGPEPVRAPDLAAAARLVAA